MAASGHLKAASGDCAGLQANRPRRWRFQPPVRFPAIGTKSGITMQKKNKNGICGWEHRAHLIIVCRQRRHHDSALSFDERRHHDSALSFDAEEEDATRAPCSAAARTLPRRTMCGGFWYFWPQKYKKKKVCENDDLPQTSQTFSVKVRKTFFSAFRWRKAAKATRPIPMPASGRLKAASGDYSRVCKQTVPSAGAFSRPSASPPSEPSRGLTLREKEVHFCRGNKRGIYQGETRNRYYYTHCRHRRHP